MIDLDINFFDLNMLKEFKTFDDFKKFFETELKCIKYIIDLRFNGVLTCPRCGCNKCYKLKQQGCFKCSKCIKPFTIKIGTIFEDSALPLTKWFEAMYWEVATIKGISSVQLAKHIGVCQKTAWFVLQRIRWALANNTIEKMSGDIQIDETYVGGKNSNKHKDKQMPLSQGQL